MNDEFELMCKAFYEHGDVDIKWEGISDNSKNWVRTRMRCAIQAINMTLIDREGAKK